MNEKETISYIINTSKNIAIFALSPDKTKASYRVAEFLQRKNYKIFPICRRKNKISIWKNKTSIKVEILFFYKP
ncbi:hypothetical protein DT955_02920 [Campylobacter jejuni]|nr:hypothetical protein [Campylobacter jejuni]